jgi:hypothetical protein
MSYFAGLDWGNVEHAACVVDEQGQVVQRLVVPHTREGLHTLLAALARLGATSLLPIAIERPSGGLVVDTLVEAGHPVLPTSCELSRALVRTRTHLVTERVALAN